MSYRSKKHKPRKEHEDVDYHAIRAEADEHGPFEDVEITTVKAQIPYCLECGSENVKCVKEYDTGYAGCHCKNCGGDEIRWKEGEVEVEKKVWRER